MLVRSGHTCDTRHKPGARCNKHLGSDEGCRRQLANYNYCFNYRDYNSELILKSEWESCGTLLGPCRFHIQETVCDWFVPDDCCDVIYVTGTQSDPRSHTLRTVIRDCEPYYLSIIQWFLHWFPHWVIYWFPPVLGLLFTSVFRDDKQAALLHGPKLSDKSCVPRRQRFRHYTTGGNVAILIIYFYNFPKHAPAAFSRR